jgi:hypothetical protein
MNFFALLLCVVLGTAQGPRVGKVESTFDENTNFTALRTYVWERGYDAYDPKVHDTVVAIVESEMAKLGFTKVTANPQVRLSYYTVRSAEIDLDVLDDLEDEDYVGEPPTRTLARLMIVMRKPSGIDQRLWSASTRTYVDRAPTEVAIAAAVRRIFSKYPGLDR